MDVRGYGADGRGYGVDVRGYGVDVRGCGVDGRGYGVDAALRSPHAPAATFARGFARCQRPSVFVFCPPGILSEAAVVTVKAVIR